MKANSIILAVLIIMIALDGFCQVNNFSFSAKIKVSEELQDFTKKEGRLFIFLTQNPNIEPRLQTWPNPRSLTHIFARNIYDLNATQIVKIDKSEKWDRTPEWTFENIPIGQYYIQILWDQDTLESRVNAPGNLYSTKQYVDVNQSVELDVILDKKIKPRNVKKHDLVRVVDFKSDTLSKWWDKSIYLKASILLPNQYDKSKAYPIRYNVAGYGGRYTRINWILNNNDFMDWWNSNEAPQIINVFLDGEGPFGDSYQFDSENSGPYGYALINELIPHIESKYRGTNLSDTRFVDGCSTGGWVSLGLQLFYPDYFNGSFSYSPDAVEFENYLLVNIYKDDNVYINEYDYLRPTMRSVEGEPMVSFKQFVQYENVLGTSGTYLNSGGQMGAHTALYSPRDEDGWPMPLFDPVTGEIDLIVAQYWRKYDFKLYAKKNWKELGPKLQGKIFIWMGDMDNFYLNSATREFASYLNNTTNPASDADIVFSSMEGHCWQYSHKKVLLKIQKKIEQNKGKTNGNY